MTFKVEPSTVARTLDRTPVRVPAYDTSEMGTYCGECEESTVFSENQRGAAGKATYDAGAFAHTAGRNGVPVGVLEEVRA